MHLNQPIIGMGATPTGAGYWLVARDGGVFTFGDARFHGSGSGAPSLQFAGMAPTPTGDGYWLVTRTGSVFAFGAARWHGDLSYSRPVVAILASLRWEGLLGLHRRRLREVVRRRAPAQHRDRRRHEPAGASCRGGGPVRVLGDAQHDAAGLGFGLDVAGGGDDLFERVVAVDHRAVFARLYEMFDEFDVGSGVAREWECDALRPKRAVHSANTGSAARVRGPWKGTCPRP